MDMNETGAPTVTVVVPTYDDKGLTACLEALVALQPPPGWEVDVVVVDNASAVSPAPLVQAQPGMRCLYEGRRGSYAARNTGIAAGRGEVFAFTDADCRPEPTWLSAAVARLEAEPDLAALAGRVRTVFDGAGPRTPAGWWESVEAFPQERYVRTGYGVTANLVVRREVGEALGWFDAAALSGGDSEFGRRLTGAGYRLGYADDAVVDHPARTTWSALLGKARRTAMGRTRIERLKGRGWPAFGREVLWQFVQMAVVVKRAATNDALPTVSARLGYLSAGLVFRAYWLQQMVRWELRFRALAARGELT